MSARENPRKKVPGAHQSAICGRRSYNELMKYTKDFLDEALSQLQTPDCKERKRVATVFMRAACKELGTKDTKPIKEWFLINQEAFFSSIAEETEPEILWTHLYTLQNFCARYIHLSHLYRAESSLITEDKVRKFEEQSKAYVQGLRKTQMHPKVLQGIASFFWIYRESFVWDIFVEVLKKKRDQLTLSHIGVAIRQCCSLVQEEGRVCISERQRRELTEIMEAKQVLQREAELLKALSCSG